MFKFYGNMIRWNLPSSKREYAEELANYVGHELADREITGDELERELVISYYELKELHEESNVTLAEWSQWVKNGIEEYKSWI
jgi:hypothetical protein